MGRRRRFSSEQDADIARLYAESLTIKAIAARYGSSQSAVRHSLLRSDVALRPRSSPRPEYEWVRCACGRRASYRTGQCVNCYNVTRNALPDVKKRHRDWKLMTHHGLTGDAYDMLLKQQGGACAVCQRPDASGIRLAIDHDHTCCPGDASCGKCRRGLLCSYCNRAVGLMGDSADTALRLHNYLIRAR